MMCQCELWILSVCTVRVISQKIHEWRTEINLVIAGNLPNVTVLSLRETINRILSAANG